VEQNQPTLQPSKSSSGRFDLSTLAIIGALAVMVVTSLMNMWNINRVSQSLNQRVSKLEAIVGGPQRPEPDPKKVHQVRIDGAPAKGPNSAPVTIVEFSEFQCPFCLKVEPTIKRIQEVYSTQVRVVWKHMPLSIHRNALDAAVAAEAARRQDKFWEYHDRLFANQQKLDPENLQEYAKELQLDMARFDKDRLDPEIRKRIEADKAEAETIGVNATPTFFINGRYVRGAQPFETLAKVIDEELAKRNVPVPSRPSSN
jgi:protein-disulfide isomerase